MTTDGSASKGNAAQLRQAGYHPETKRDAALWTQSGIIEQELQHGTEAQF